MQTYSKEIIEKFEEIAKIYGSSKESVIADYEKWRHESEIDPSRRETQKYYLADIESMELLFTITKKEKIFTLCTDNVFQVLLHNWKTFGSFRYDEFKNVFEIKDIKTLKWRPLEESDYIFVQTSLSSAYEFLQKVPKAMVVDAITKLSIKNKVDSAQEYVKSLKWDGEPRLDSWLTKTYGVPNDEYHQSIGSNWIKGMIARIMYPGSKFDYVIVLEGEQGSKKSMSLAVLGGDWHVETTMGTDNKDFFMMLQGKTIVEFAEGSTFTRTDVLRMKAIITTQVDKYRPPYERVSKDFPRRCVFAMTTNQSEYLKDDTGNRRWFPVKVVLPEADVEWLRNNRDQIFAEAYHRVVNLKENYWEFPKDETLAQQKDRRIREANEDIVINWYDNVLSEERKKEGITVNEVYNECICGYSPGSWTKAMTRLEEIQMANILKDGLGLIKERRLVNGVRANRWFKEKDIILSGIVEDSLARSSEIKQTELVEQGF